MKKHITFIFSAMFFFLTACSTIANLNIEESHLNGAEESVSKTVILGQGEEESTASFTTVTP